MCRDTMRLYDVSAALIPEEGLTLKLTSKSLISREKVTCTFNITSFFLNETCINMMKRIFPEKASNRPANDRPRIGTTCPRMGNSGASTIFFKITEKPQALNQPKRNYILGKSQLAPALLR